MNVLYLRTRQLHARKNNVPPRQGPGGTRSVSPNALLLLWLLLFRGFCPLSSTLFLWGAPVFSFIRRQVVLLYILDVVELRLQPMLICPRIDCGPDDVFEFFALLFCE